MATVKYGDYTFTPSPNVTIQRDIFKTANNSRAIGALYRVTLAGTRISGLRTLIPAAFGIILIKIIDFFRLPLQIAELKSWEGPL